MELSVQGRPERERERERKKWGEMRSRAKMGETDIHLTDGTRLVDVKMYPAKSTARKYLKALVHIHQH